MELRFRALMVNILLPAFLVISLVLDYLIPTHNKQLSEGFVSNVPIAANLMTVSLVAGTAAPLGYLCPCSGRVLYSGINISAISTDNLGIKWVLFAHLPVSICEMVLTVLGPSFKLCLDCLSSNSLSFLQIDNNTTLILYSVAGTLSSDF